MCLACICMRGKALRTTIRIHSPSTISSSRLRHTRSKYDTMSRVVGLRRKFSSRQTVPSQMIGCRATEEGVENQDAVEKGLDVSDFLAVHEFFTVKEGEEENFAQAAAINAINSLDFPGVIRFDVLQSEANPGQFVVVKVFQDWNIPKDLEETEFYTTFQEISANMLLKPSETLRMRVVFPFKPKNWVYQNLDDDIEQEVYCQHTTVRIREGRETQFIMMTLANARGSIVEDGVARFDILQFIDDPQQFMLVKVFESPEAEDDFSVSSEQRRWIRICEETELLASPIGTAKFSNIFPLEVGNWKYVSQLA
ncbi:hypothetical protein AAMO2058_001392600 [Amorphochlora amoebiformis]